MSKSKHFDFCVCGNGMVGSVAALALAQRGFSVAWVTPEEIKPFRADDLPDLRMSAISIGSIKLLEHVGVWQTILAMRARPYTRLRVWELDGMETYFDAQHIGASNLGYFVENRLIQYACSVASEQFTHITRFNTRVDNVLHSKDTVCIELGNNRALNASWVIGAEGANSKVRQQSGIATQAWQYTQQALGIVVELNEPSVDETWQQFFPSGPRAYLPMYDNYAALIWYDSATTLAALKQLGDEQLLASIQQHFPRRLQGLKRVVNKAQFPLTRMHASDYLKRRAILIGDAAHTVNPLAGQGVNLGFGDITALLKAVDKQTTNSVSADAFARALQRDYGFFHKQHNATMMAALDGIYKGFKHPHPLAKLVRNTVLWGTQHSDIVKHQVIRFAAGLL